MEPRVSILIPCYNAERWVAEAIESALAQTWPNKEVIVVDDGSKDKSFEIVQRYAGRIRCETQPNRGGNPTRNRLLELATGDWVQYLDADDALLPDKVEAQARLVTERPEVDIFYSPVVLLTHEPDGSTRREPMPIPEPHDPWVLLARWYLPQTGGPLWRKQAIVDVGGWKPDQPCCQEHELYLRLLKGGKRFEHVEHFGALYRQWGESTVWKKDRSETRRRRLAVTDELERFLEERGELTPRRLHAVQTSRLEIARNVWQSDRALARELVRRAHARVRPVELEGAPFPPMYRKLYRLLGFEAAEHIATLKRRLLGR